MTIAVIEAPEAVLDAEPAKLDVEGGLLAVQDQIPLTELQSVDLDQTGGLEVIDAVLREDTGCYCIIEHVEPKPSPFQRFRQLARRVLRQVRDALSASLAWLAAPVVSSYRRRTYRSRHGVQVRWFGVQLSTSRRVAAVRRRSTPRPPQEPALPGLTYDYEHWCSHMANIIESLRLHEELRSHVPEHGRSFVCS